MRGRAPANGQTLLTGCAHLRGTNNDGRRGSGNHLDLSVLSRSV